STRRGPAAGRIDLLCRRRRANRRLGGSARIERYAHTAPFCRDLFLGRWLQHVLCARLPARLWRDRHLDRTRCRARGLCRAIDLALPCAHQARVSSRTRHSGLGSNRTAMTERLIITHLAHRGDGVAETAAGPVFLPYTLPGETVDVESIPGHPDRRRLLRIEVPSPERIDPFCPHFGTCGGCAIQHWTAERYRDWKRNLVAAALAQAGLDAPVDDLIDAHGEGRRRATFHARVSERGESTVGFAAVREHHIVAIDRCPVL